MLQYPTNRRWCKSSENEISKDVAKKHRNPFLFIIERPCTFTQIFIHLTCISHTTIALYVHAGKDNYMIKLEVELSIGCIVSHRVYANEGDLLLGPLVLFSDLLLFFG
jgi:hypothetical protein